ncbi:MAG TPA: hypothetical protein VFU55_06525 [Terracidiphilus sp.]|nr:hypothetical protein [Terracidiphilus sp.]
MQQGTESGVRPALKALAAEATHALALLDAERLEELARSCEALNRELAHAGPKERAAWARDAADAAKGMAVFSRVLDVTRSNGRVLRRLIELRAGQAEYGPFADGPVKMLESGDGHN